MIQIDIELFRDQTIVLRIRQRFKRIDVNGKTATKDTNVVSLFLRKRM